MNIWLFAQAHPQVAASDLIPVHPGHTFGSRKAGRCQLVSLNSISLRMLRLGSQMPHACSGKLPQSQALCAKGQACRQARRLPCNLKHRRNGLATPGILPQWRSCFAIHAQADATAFSVVAEAWQLADSYRNWVRTPGLLNSVKVCRMNVSWWELA